MTLRERIKALEAKGDDTSLREAKIYKFAICKHVDGHICKWLVRPELRTWQCRWCASGETGPAVDLMEALKTAAFQCPAGHFNVESKPKTTAGPRLAVCNACDEFGTVCEKQFPTGACCTTWKRFVNDPESKCPLGKWKDDGNGNAGA